MVQQIRNYLEQPDCEVLIHRRSPSAIVRSAPRTVPIQDLGCVEAQVNTSVQVKKRVIIQILFGVPMRDRLDQTHTRPLTLTCVAPEGKKMLALHLGVLL